MYKKKLYCGVGVNDVNYKTTVDGVKCPYHVRWKKMLMRCYSDKWKDAHPSYVGCTVCVEWLTFSNFRKWIIEQEVIHGTLYDMQLDKDIIDPSNKMYSPDKCALVSKRVNTFVLDSGESRGEFPIGVTRRSNGRFSSSCSSPFGGKINLGTFETPEEAHEAWKSQKHIFACQLAKVEHDPRIVMSLSVRYS